METTMVICGDIFDFKNWLLINIGHTPNSRNRVITFNNRRYIAVSQVEHMCGYRCDTVSFTELGRERENFQQLMRSAECCLAQPKKPFKFGR